MKRRFSMWTWLALAVAGWVACGASGEAELVVSITPRTVRSDGLDAASITITAKDENGAIGTGAVRVTTVGGSLSDGVDLTLDAYGKAQTTFTCDKAVDASCTGDVRVVAEWTRPGKSTVTATGRVSIDGGSGTGGSGGSGGGGGSLPVCPNAKPLCLTNPNAAVFWGVSPPEYWKLTTETQGSIKEIFTLNVSGGGSCSGSTCTSVSANVVNLQADGGITNLLTWDGRAVNDETIGVAGSMDEPTLHTGHYADGKLIPPVSYQPIFNMGLCPTSHVVAFDICRLTVNNGVVQEFLMSFHARCTHMYTVEVDGCVHFTR